MEFRRPNTKMTEFMTSWKKTLKRTNVAKRQHDPTGALTLVATDQVWHEMPVNVTNPADVLNGQPPTYRARPTWDMPAQHAANAAAAVVSIYKQELARYTEYTPG